MAVPRSGHAATGAKAVPHPANAARCNVMPELMREVIHGARTVTGEALSCTFLFSAFRVLPLVLAHGCRPKERQI